MKLDMPKWKALSIKNRLKKGFRLTTFVASASGVIAGILMILVSMRYSSALTFYGFSQGDIGKVMVTFSETRSATRALIGYTASDTLSKMSDTHDSKKESFQKYWKELQSSIRLSYLTLTSFLERWQKEIIQFHQTWKINIPEILLDFSWQCVR